MIIASTLFLIIGIVTFVIGVFARDDVGLIVVSIGASAVAALTLAVGVVRDRKRLAAEGLGIPEASTFTEASPTPGEPVATIVGEDTPTVSIPAAAPTVEAEGAPIVLPVEDEPAPARESASVRAARASVAKTTAKKTAAKKPAAKKTAAKKPAKKPAAKKAAKKPAAKKPAAKKPAAKKAAAKKPAAKSAAKKPAAKKTAAKKKTTAAPSAEGASPPPPPPPPPPSA